VGLEKRTPMGQTFSIPFTAGAVGVLLSFAGQLNAGQPVPAFHAAPKEVVLRETPFDRGRHEFQAMAGTFFSVDHSPDLDYAVGTLRLGWMLSSPRGDGVFRGNCEFLLEVFGGGIFEGPGDGLAGATVLLRYNFVQPDARFVPYLQIGAGGLYSDADRDGAQRLIGEAFEFNLQASLGLRAFLSDKCAVSLEGGYRHISNANLADRNVGVDSVGGQVGLSWFW